MSTKTGVSLAPLNQPPAGMGWCCMGGKISRLPTLGIHDFCLQKRFYIFNIQGSEFILSYA